jgi:hypothetical protein
MISTDWTFNETPLGLGAHDPLDDDEFELTLDSDSEEWDEKCLNLAPEMDL